MGEVSTIGLDIAKSVFQIHGVDAEGAVVIRKRIGRAKLLGFFSELPRCLIGIEACPTAHHWSRELQALGHAVKLMPPSYVKAYLRWAKNDANDAAAICEAVSRPSMHFVATKTLDQQALADGSTAYYWCRPWWARGGDCPLSNEALGCHLDKMRQRAGVLNALLDAWRIGRKS